MKKLIILFILISAIAISGRGQDKADDLGRIALNTYLPVESNLTADTRNLLETKLNQISTTYGMNGSEINPRFIITAAINIGTKDIIAGPPQMIAQNMEMTIFIGDAIENKIFSNLILNLKGVGTNENKALIDAIKTINAKDKGISLFVEEAKSKIIIYYNTQCNFLLKDALALRKSGKYNEAIYKLSIVPDVCQECYFRCMDTLNIIFQQKINQDCKVLLQQAKSAWAVKQNTEGAEEVAELLRQIQPGASCQNEVDVFIKTVTEKLDANAKAEWKFKMKQYEDQVAMEKEQVKLQGEQSARNQELDKIRINAYREIAVEYAKNQPKTVYSNIYWR